MELRAPQQGLFAGLAGHLVGNSRRRLIARATVAAFTRQADHAGPGQYFRASNARAGAHAALRPLPPEPLILPHPEIGVPVLAGRPTQPLPATPAKTGAPVHQAATIASTGGGIGHLRPTGDKFVSSYADGLSELPHPPYPPEARDLQETGIVRMLVQFDKAGNVERADVAGSSGVAVLDAETRDFIRSNWHSRTYAGRALSVPVAYTLTSL